MNYGYFIFFPQGLGSSPFRLNFCISGGSCTACPRVARLVTSWSQTQH